MMENVKANAGLVDFGKEITKRLDQVAIQLLEEALADGSKDPLPLPQRLDVFTSVAKYLAIKTKSTDEDSKGEALDVYAKQLKQDAGGKRENGGGSDPKSRISPFARTTSPEANGGSLLNRIKSSIPSAGDGSA